jgi:hypothetical protein
LVLVEQVLQQIIPAEEMVARLLSGLLFPTVVEAVPIMETVVVVVAY